MHIYMAPEIRIELILTESKSVVLPIHHSGTFGTQIFKEQLARWPKQKTLGTFISEGFGKYTGRLSLTYQNPLNHSQSHILILCVSMSSH
jgi:hypothetical protein